jgi:hypothetical protein
MIKMLLLRKSQADGCPEKGYLNTWRYIQEDFSSNSVK